jgi:hypothetical protein
MAVRRRYYPAAGDRIVVGDYEIDYAILSGILTSEARVLWAFVHNEAGDTQALPFTEEQVIWIDQLAKEAR